MNAIPALLSWKAVNVAIIRDITERKAAEQESRSLREQLARSQKMEALGLLAGGVAHDLNNILSGIVSYPDLLLRRGNLDDKTRKALHTIQDAGQRAADVVNDMTTITRGVASSREGIHINTVIKQYLASPEYRKLKQYHPNVLIETDLDEQLRYISGSRLHVQKTVMNLVTNAYEALENNGIVGVATKNCTLNGRLPGYQEHINGDFVRLSISDNGPGITTEDMERVFEPFYTKKVMGRSGTGLGLTVVWNTVQDHGGYVDVSSDSSGTRFDLYFPAVSEQVAKPKDAETINNYQGNGQTILVVDDEKNQREIATQILNFLGYSADAVPSGEAAVACIREKPVDLVVPDMIMPSGMDGRQTYETILSIHPGQKALIASGFSITDDVLAMQRRGAGRFIKKPYTIDKLGQAVHAELSGKTEKMS